MSKYIVSARKYRPSRFGEVVGQKAITVTLRNAVVSGHIAQAYLFCGPRGVGKTTVARILAKAINCSNPGADGEPCNECESCQAFNENRSYNIHELDAASNNKVDDIKSLIEKVRIPPQLGKYSVYIIDEVHMLSASAFNAFLKTLEEPPEYAVFILATTEKQKIIPTILSRCQIYDFNRISVDDIVGHLKYVAEAEGVTADEESLAVIATKADGALRDALSTFDQLVAFAGDTLDYAEVIKNLNVLDYDYYFRLTDLLYQGNFEEAVILLDEILMKGFDVRDILSGLAKHFRELLLATDKRTVALMEVGQTIRDKFLQQAGAVDPEFLKKALSFSYQSDITLRNSRNQRLHVEILLLQISSLKKNSISPDFASEKEVLSPETLQNKGKKKVPAQEQKASSPETTSTQATVEKKVPVKSAPEKDEQITTEPPGEGKSDGMAREGIKETEDATGSGDEVQKPNVADEPADNTGNTDIAGAAASERLVSEPADEYDDPGSVSIKKVLENISNGKNNRHEENNAPAEKNSGSDPVVLREIKPDDLNNAWLDFADLLNDDKPRFASALRTHLPSLEVPHTVVVVFENKNLQEDFERNLKSDLLEYLIKKLGNTEIDISVRVEKEGGKEKKPYTPEEKYRKMKEKNPEIERLRQQFNLDFE